MWRIATGTDTTNPTISNFKVGTGTTQDAITLVGNEYQANTKFLGGEGPINYQAGWLQGCYKLTRPVNDFTPRHCLLSDSASDYREMTFQFTRVYGADTYLDVTYTHNIDPCPGQ